MITVEIKYILVEVFAVISDMPPTTTAAKITLNKCLVLFTWHPVSFYYSSIAETAVGSTLNY